MAIEARHGGYSRVKTRKQNAVSGVKMDVRAVCKLFAFTLSNTLKVPTIASFAVIPVNNAVTISQFLNPSGKNIGSINLLIEASRLFEGFLTKFSFKSKIFCF